MSTVRVGGIVFQVFPYDHEPRHVHGLYAGIEVIVDLLDGERSRCLIALMRSHLQTQSGMM